MQLEGTDLRSSGRDSAVPDAEERCCYEAVGVSHAYAGTLALRNVSLALDGGEVHGLAGENGSGKSTLIKTLTGALAPGSGRLVLDGAETRLSSPGAAVRLGIGVVHQDYNVFPDLTVSDNVFGVTSTPPRRLISRRIDRGAVGRRIRALFEELAIDISPDARVRSLDPAERKFVEIARSMLMRPRVLILDEPTASLEPSAAASVLELMERLRAQGVALCFVTHRLDELVRVADKVTVLRDGTVAGRLDRSELNERAVTKLILGDKSDAPVSTTLARDRPRATKVAFRVEGARVLPGAPPTDLEVRRGEILGLTGLVGSGAEQLVKMLAGAVPLAGRVSIDGDVSDIRTPRDALRLGIGFIPEDRRALGVLPDASVAVNLSIASLGAVSRRSVLSRSSMERRAEEYREKLGIKLRSVRAPIRTLSGGNIQKVLIARWLASGVRILAIEEPTHGIDIGAKAQVHALLQQFTSDGGTIVMASTDIDEVLSMCDRIAIFRHGAVVEVLDMATELDARESRSHDLLERLIGGEVAGGA